MKRHYKQLLIILVLFASRIITSGSTVAVNKSNGQTGITYSESSQPQPNPGKPKPITSLKKRNSIYLRRLVKAITKNNTDQSYNNFDNIPDLDNSIFNIPQLNNTSDTSLTQNPTTDNGSTAIHKSNKQQSNRQLFGPYMYDPYNMGMMGMFNPYMYGIHHPYAWGGHHPMAYNMFMYPYMMAMNPMMAMMAMNPMMMWNPAMMMAMSGMYSGVDMQGFNGQNSAQSQTQGNATDDNNGKQEKQKRKLTRNRLSGVTIAGFEDVVSKKLENGLKEIAKKLQELQVEASKNTDEYSGKL